jgi:CelD/BcsL family acetyltransferase involved in cellulose biosynthesis
MSHAVTVRIAREESEWDAVRSEWNALFDASPHAPPALHFIWLRTWWATYGAAYGSGGLRIATVWRGSRLIGALPLYAGGDRGPFDAPTLRFLSTGEAEWEETCPEYLDLLYLPGEEDTCLAAVSDVVARLTWDKLELLDVSSGSPLVTQFTPGATVASSARGACPVADLEGGFDAYLARLSPNSRQQARRLLRGAARAGATFELAAPEAGDRAFGDLVRLHQMRWNSEGRPGVFAAPRFTAFHRALVREWLPSGRAILARLAVGEECLAVLYGFRSGGAFAFYQSGVDLSRAGAIDSPGIVAHLLLIKALAQAGVMEYDFLRGRASYKTRLSTRERPVVALQAWRPTLRAGACRSLQLASRAARRGLRLLRSRPA